MKATAVKIHPSTCPTWCEGQHPATGPRLHAGPSVAVGVDRGYGPQPTAVGLTRLDDGDLGKVELWISGLEVSIPSADFPALRALLAEAL